MNRRSMEAEARDLLRAAVAPETARPPIDPAAAKAALERLWSKSAEIKARLPEGWSVVDELIAERRLEAAFETGAISAQERFDRLEKLQRFELWPKEVEAFAMQKLAEHD
ncbi:MAG: hypothetical protein IT546_05215 [Caulobacteraceae bacterium]|nr:hypothetical protein [Caulobacteraceae bacterium]